MTKLQGLRCKLMPKLLCISETCNIIQRLNSYNLLNNKVAEKSLEQFTDRMKKAEKLLASWKQTFHKEQYLKPSNINLALISEHVRKKLWKLTCQKFSRFRDFFAKSRNLIAANIKIFSQRRNFIPRISNTFWLTAKF